MGTSIRRRTISLLATAAVMGVWLSVLVSPGAALAKTCSAGYIHAIIGGEQKCLRRGEFCAHSYANQYRRYRFTCSYYVKGQYHLEPLG